MNYEKIEKVIKDNNGRMTKSRKHLAEIFLNEPTRHFTIDELINILEKQGEKNVATVYNNLAAFVEFNLVYEFTFNHKKHYELAHGIHGHFICERCKEVTNVELPGFSCIAMNINKTTGALVRNNNIEFYGCCLECQHKECDECDSCTLCQENQCQNEECKEN